MLKIGLMSDEFRSGTPINDPQESETPLCGICYSGFGVSNVPTGDFFGTAVLSRRFIGFLSQPMLSFYLSPLVPRQVECGEAEHVNEGFCWQDISGILRARLSWQLNTYNRDHLQPIFSILSSRQILDSFWNNIQFYIKLLTVINMFRITPSGWP